MRPAPFRTRLATVRAALRSQPALRERDTWSREQLAAHQRARLQEVVRHAAQRSAFYRETLADVDLRRPVELGDLPEVRKDALMERFDDWLTDPRLRRARVERHLAGLAGDELLDGEYRVMATGGSTGTRGVFVYSAAEWTALMAQFLRVMRVWGMAPKVPRRRLCSVSAPTPAHMTWRLTASIDVGLHRRLALAATEPVDTLVARLNAFRPDFVNAYPSVAALLADEQLEGRLSIAPAVVSTSSELCTPEMRARMRAAWRVEPKELYGATDGLWGWTCEHGRMHFGEDETIVEVVDAEGRPVPDGQVGHRLLITNLFLRTQPVIRYEITDMVRVDPAPCPCGRAFRTIAAIVGRSDDILTLAGERGAVAVHPIVVRSPLAHLETVRQYQVVNRVDGLHVLVVPRGDPATVTGEVRAAVTGALRAAGATATPVRVTAVGALERDSGPVGKLRLVRNELAAGAQAQVR